MRETLSAEMEKERGTVETQIAAKLAEAEARIAQTKAGALAGVSDIAGELAGAIVARLSGRKVSKDEVAKALVNRQAAE
jgi:F-type H+-transporting ATPase subunit b